MLSTNSFIFHPINQNNIKDSEKSNVNEFYNVIEKSNNKEYFCKKILINQNKINYTRTYIKEEIDIHISLDNPNIIQLYHYFEDETHFYLILEKGEIDFYDYFSKKLNRTPINESKVIEYVKQIIDAVLYLHSNKIIHSDIKLDNLILINNKVKLTDFGLSFIGRETIKSIVGTKHYMAPEMLLKSQNHDTKTEVTNKIDIYSIGVCIYILLFGGFVVYHKNNIHFFEDLNKISQNMKDFINKLLEKDPEKRIDIFEAKKIIESM